MLSQIIEEEIGSRITRTIALPGRPTTRMIMTAVDCDLHNPKDCPFHIKVTREGDPASSIDASLAMVEGYILYRLMTEGSLTYQELIESAKDESIERLVKEGETYEDAFDRLKHTIIKQIYNIRNRIEPVTSDPYLIVNIDNYGYCIPSKNLMEHSFGIPRFAGHRLFYHQGKGFISLTEDEAFLFQAIEEAYVPGYAVDRNALASKAASEEEISRRTFRKRLEQLIGKFPGLIHASRDSICASYGLDMAELREGLRYSRAGLLESEGRFLLLTQAQALALKAVADHQYLDKMGQASKAGITKEVLRRRLGTIDTALAEAFGINPGIFYSTNGSGYRIGNNHK